MGEQVAAGYIWGCSSVGRAPALQAGGHEFESHHLHESNEPCQKPTLRITNNQIFIASDVNR